MGHNGVHNYTRVTHLTINTVLRSTTFEERPLGKA